ncbi:hypothetical protein TGME49_279350 [Toxoplasma gondii ME49]|uniref:Transmembrane protein n=3 Tax=Toxoplasma gondii TaxID=5811 RepID=S8G730_TOXGM|nr:hypothetical protein TGME49_279350 [Toxoplasma gondii ME49]EPT27530.1 hypothetical protein TGME49_279350 [Toxoplasma gondii ME49]KYF45673.1 hypothetical protein TGARI_279350 [Toxoplasma gondii ARI]PIM02194.1 putative transmembrane protein [Toxoplasma gondii COUG]|eukprot:XP_018636209.1 hypothetical protein TGME49_279350 [Toxoplasma gondii ME49]
MSVNYIVLQAHVQVFRASSEAPIDMTFLIIGSAPSVQLPSPKKEQTVHIRSSSFCRISKHYFTMERHTILKRPLFLVCSPRNLYLFLLLAAVFSPCTVHDKHQTRSVYSVLRIIWGLNFVRAARPVEKDDSGEDGEWLGDLGGTNNLLLPGARATQMNKPKVVAKQKRVGEGSKSTTPKALQVAKPGWKAFYDNAKKKLFTGTVTNTAIWSAIVVAVTMFVTFGAYRSLNRFRDTRFEQMDHELSDLRARREELAQQNPRERFIEAAGMEKQHAEALRDILETVRRSPGSAELLLHPGIEGDSDLALASLVSMFSVAPSCDCSVSCGTV